MRRMSEAVRNALLLLLLFSIQPGLSQIRISEEVQPSRVANAGEYSLYLVDFWATWCGPCVGAKKYLTVLQKQMPSDFYIVSLTQESPDVVKKFLRKNPAELAVAIDYDRETFRKHRINSLPTAVLYGANGRVLWEGHPANLKPGDIKKFLRYEIKPLKPSEFIRQVSYAMSEVVENDAVLPEEDLEISSSDRAPGILEIRNSNGFTSYEGQLNSILSILLGVSESQVRLNKDVSNEVFLISVKNGTRKDRQLLKQVLKRLKLRIDDKEDKGEVLVLQTDGSGFWGDDQINWGNDNPKYLIDDSQIQADNVSFEEIKYRLAGLLEMPVVSNSVNDPSLHDWQVHYKYFELMQADLLDNYGIKAEKKTQSFPVYHILKKAP